MMTESDGDRLARALKEAQAAIEAELKHIKGLPSDHARVLAFAVALEEHANRIEEFSERVRHALQSHLN